MLKHEGMFEERSDEFAESASIEEIVFLDRRDKQKVTRLLCGLQKRFYE
jgi:hypothetical protein